ncbi:MAG: CBS domain-containing protein [Chromatiaceae bacterium]|jgi:CBS domain-containing protein|nr:CBS domain-containing protein [Chromatiaceae bacterium]
MKTVREILDEKGRDVWTIGPNASVREALSRMAQQNVGALVVIEGDRVVGVISERDYARKVIVNRQPPLEISTADIMVRQPRCVTPEETIADCMALMTDKHVRHLPVLEGGSLAGIVSIGDLVKSIIRAQESKIDELESLIYGS